MGASRKVPADNIKEVDEGQQRIGRGHLHVTPVGLPLSLLSS